LFRGGRGVVQQLLLLLPLLLGKALWLTRIAAAAAGVAASAAAASSSVPLNGRQRPGNEAAPAAAAKRQQQEDQQQQQPPRRRRRRRKARVLLVGSGRMGRIRAKILHSLGGAELAGIVDADAESAAELAEMYCGGGGTLSTRLPVFGSVADAVRELGAGGGGGGGAPPPLLGCVICTPTPTHGPLIREAAGCGLSVFVEKPVAEDPGEVEELFGACESAGVRLCCGFQRRFDPSYAACRDAVASGGIGEPVYAHLFFADHPVPPREYLLGSGGNIFVDLLAHDVDFALDALGDEVADVRAVASSSDPDLGAAGVRDTASALLTTRKGAPLPAIFVAIRCLLPCPHFVSHVPGGSLVCQKKRTRACCAARQARRSPCS
jgi:predicted dehydrogenase